MFVIQIFWQNNGKKADLSSLTCPAVLFQLSCLSYPVLSHLSCSLYSDPGCPLLAALLVFLSQLPCPNCPVIVLANLSSILPRLTFQTDLFRLSRMSCSSCPVMVVLVPDHDGGRPMEVNACILITHMVHLQWALKVYSAQKVYSVPLSMQF
jgi:hypothetical protein